MRKLFFPLMMIMSISILGLSFNTQAQQTKDAAAFHGAKAVKKEYKAIFELNSDDDKVIRGTLRNMAHVLDDPRIKGKIQLELVAHSGGIVSLLKGNDYGDILKKLVDQGVIIAACENTLKGKDISKSALLPFVSTVPSGVGELIIRQQQGWAIVHP